MHMFVIITHVYVGLTAFRFSFPSFFLLQPTPSHLPFGGSHHHMWSGVSNMKMLSELMVTGWYVRLPYRVARSEDERRVCCWGHPHMQFRA